MALINNKFQVTITDDWSTDPGINQEVNFTENKYDKYAVVTITIPKGASGTNWYDAAATQLIGTTDAKYVVMTIDNPAYLWMLGRTPDLAVQSDIDAKQTVDTLMVLNGSYKNIYIANPTTEDDAVNYDLHIKLVYVYA